ncbi:MAG: Hsp20/alpha crystallin family protein [Solirubrobacterales bacterium]|nr:Hsp20/alpha crystallin family protein [Solirubrobacterales bacterium]
MALIRWEPVPMNRFFNSLFDTPTAQHMATRRWLPATDLIESDTHYVLRADLPGISEDDIHVELDNDVLTISGERRTEQRRSENGYHRIERSSGSFRRSVRLPKGVDAEQIAANFDKGVLEVSIPKPEQVKPRKVAVTVGREQPETIESGDAAETSEPQAA